MSAINYENLKSANDDTIPFRNNKELLLKTVIKFDSLLRFGMLLKSVRVVNNDSTGEILVQTGSNQAVPEKIPPNMEQTFEGWFSKLIVTPDPVTGDGLLDYDMSTSKDASQK